jgi:IclR family transcriptional regulator, acetate operon repressor
MVDGDKSLWGVRELARECGWPPSTAFRVLQSLSEEGFVQDDEESGRYGLGLEFFRLARRTVDALPLQRLCLPVMRELVDTCNETALLNAYDHGRMQMMCVAKVDSQHHLRYVLDLGVWNDIHSGASGLAITAFLPEKEIEQVIRRTGLRAVTASTITSSVLFRKELEKIRQNGYAITKGQRIPGSVGIGAPIWSRGGVVVGSLSLTIPEQRFDPSVQEDLAGLVIGCAARI